MSQPSARYRARIAEEDYAVEIGADRLTVNAQDRAARLSHVSNDSYLLSLDGHQHRITLEGRDGDQLTLRVNGTRLTVDVSDAQRLLLESFGLDEGSSAAQREVKAPMPGLVLAVRVQPGQQVEAGEGLLVLEAMKMENEIRASHAGTIARVHVTPGQAVTKGALLAEFEA